jgi:hypothetical protein
LYLGLSVNRLVGMGMPTADNVLPVSNIEMFYHL